MELVLKKDSIVHQKVDVIVNTTPPGLTLSNGVVSQAILQAGGDSIQQECEDKYPSGIKTKEIAQTKGGNLRCDKIYHLTLSDWANQGETELEEVISSCLTKADQDGQHSIAFPCLGSGKLKYPPDSVAAIFFKTVITFAESGPTSLQKVVIVVFHTDKANIQAFDNERAKHMFETRIRIDSRLDRTLLSNVLPARLSGRARSKRTPAVKCVVGDIVQQNADVVVNCTTPDLTLTSGPLTRAVLAAAGPGIQGECEANHPTGIHHWQVAVTSGGQLTCKHIYHTTMEKSEWDDIKQNYKGLIESLLDMADSAGLTSMAIPMLGAGVLSYPPDQVAACLFQTALAFKGSNLKTVMVVVHPNDKTNVKAVKTELRRHIHLSKSVQPAGAAFSISLVKGDICQQKVDVIVNSTTPNLNLASGPVTKAIVKVAGDSIQLECATKYPDGITAGQIAITGGGNLSCSHIYHTTLNKWSPDEQRVTELGELILRCLCQAASDGSSSIAFPVLGTGVLQYPRDVVSRVIFETCNVFSLNNAHTSLQEVRVVIHPKDVQNWRVFTHIQQHTESPETGPTGQGQNAEVPQEWSVMKASDFVTVVPVTPADSEYQSVAQNFTSTLQQAVTIVKIERIQNKTLYYQYSAMRERVTSSVPTAQTERTLWHGTSADAITSINTWGFNRSYCGKNATAYGKGVYFAASASYSVNDTYSVPDDNGCKYVFQTAVLTGEFTKGDSSMTVPPVKPNAESHIKYESVVDDPSNPSIFVIFHDTQAYPQYLITFK